MACGRWGFIGDPFRRGWRVGGGRTDERGQQALVGPAERVATAASGLEADLKRALSTVGAWRGHGRPHPRPVRTDPTGMTASTEARSLGCSGVGAPRVGR